MWKMWNIKCCKPRWVPNVVMMWIDDKQNTNVVGHANNQMTGSLDLYNINSLSI